ncbi:hypothetical protein [Streptomyces sp. NBC_01451]|uniref:hypothetical protein n=1 Tax=Streptomyces sp. NBC_01451 TaxID=2903872 RepID=UPI002E346E20|nr:hypothetical protein [Streptomyces sp. NBC_01451]
MILLTGHWDKDGNLVIETSQEYPDSTSKTELDALAYRDLPDEHKQDGWACSFLVDDHSRAVQEAHERYVREVGENSPKTIDNVWGVLVDE